MQIRSNPARWQRLKEILADALEQTSIEGRTAVLRESCADDTALFHEAERLLAKDISVFEEFAGLAAIRLRQQERHRIGGEADDDLQDHHAAGNPKYNPRTLLSR